MGSPVNQFFETIDIQKNSTQAIYIQIAQQTIDAIQRGVLPSGSRLPGTRQVAQIVGVHRKTIVAAFEELEWQDWVKVYPNKGTFVIDNNLKNKQSLKFYHSTDKKTEVPVYSFKQSHLFDTEIYPENIASFFTDGTADVRINAMVDWQKNQAAIVRKKSIWQNKNWQMDTQNQSLCNQLCNYLNLTRGLHISPKNLAITSNANMSLYLLTEILFDNNDTIAVAEKNYYKANMIFQKNGSKICAIPMDEEGIDTNKLEKICQQTSIKAVYVMPHSHYPTTVSLSKTRRLALLHLAKKYNFIIIEDDWGYDFQYEKMSSLPLYSADEQDRVIYLGELGQNLTPGYQTGFVVGNPNLISAINQFAQMVMHPTNLLMQQTMATMIKEGEIDKHLKKAKKIYQQRRIHFAELLHQKFGSQFSFKLPHGGFAFWIQLKNPKVNLIKIKQKCKENNLHLPTNILYQTQNESAMRLGFAHLDEKEMEKHLDILQKSMHTIS